MASNPCQCRVCQDCPEDPGTYPICLGCHWHRLNHVTPAPAQWHTVEERWADRMELEERRNRGK